MLFYSLLSDIAKLTKYAFIFKGPGYEGSGRSIQMNSTAFEATIVAVSSIESACNAAQKLVDQGFEVIELCGGFDDKGHEIINRAIDSTIPVGLVAFDESGQEKLDVFLNR